MENKLYQDIKNYLQTGDIPQNVPSTRANFIAAANKCVLNANGYLYRQNKPIVRISEQEAIFGAFHDHSGRTACWERIKAR